MRKALYLLAALNDRDFEWILKNGKRTQIPVGNTLIVEGQRIDALYIVLAGTFSVSVQAKGGMEIARIGSGEVLGEISFIDSRPPSATVMAMADSAVWVIPRSQLNMKLSQDVTFASHFYQAIATFLSDRLRSTVNLLGDNKSSEPVVAEDTQDSLNPQVANKLELAKARLEWLMNQ